MADAPTNPDELAKYIPFRLGALVEENAHHRFEDLCYRVAKATVATNLVPPTGPVSAGGDQGRDFESYQISGDGGAVTRFFAAIVKPTDTLVFACTTQRGSDADLVRKAKSDIDTACGREPKPTIVYYYVASSTLSPSSRHRLQDWGRATHDLHIEVVDQKLLAEILSEPANQWLAQHYLQVPSAMLGGGAPTVEVPDWYAAARTRFSSADERQLDTHAEVALVVRCARHAWSDDALTGDDGLWLDVLSDMWGAPAALETESGLRAFYEMFVYLLRGRERCGMEASIPRYVDALIDFDHIGLARDAQCFASYLVGGAQRGIIDLGRDEVAELFDKLVAWLMNKIEMAPGPVVLSDLLVARGSLVMSPLGLEDDVPDDATVQRAATETLDWWARALDVGEKLVSFPVLQLGELVNAIAPVLAESPKFDAFVDRLDSLSESRLTSEGLASINRDRASALYQSGKYLSALPPMLAARRHWHNGDRIRGSLLSSTLAIECLRHLGLYWAAKRLLFDTIAVCNRVGDREHADLLTAAVFSLAEIAYLSGDWAAATHHYAIGLRLHLEYVPDPWNWAKHQRLQAATFYLVNIIIAGDVVAPGFRAWALEVAAGWDLGDELAQFGDTVIDTWRKNGLEGGEVGSDMPLLDAPLSDIRPHRRARWRAVGIEWSFNWPNDYATEAAAIELLGTLQLLIAGLATRCAHLLPSSVNVSIRKLEGNKPHFEPLYGETGTTFVVRLPRTYDPDDPTRDARMVALVASIQLMKALSADPDFQEQVHDLAGPVIENAIFVGANPSEGRDAVFPSEAWTHTQTIPMPTREPMQVRPHDCELLPWHAGRSPLYDEQTARETLVRRYEGAFRTAQPVLQAHGLEPPFKELVDELRGEGWLDWQIAGALAPAAISLRANTLAARGADRRAVERAMREGMAAAQHGKYPVLDWSDSFEDSVRNTVRSSLVSALRVLGLDVQQAAVDIEAVRRFLDERFLHFTDDLPPEERPRFPWEETS